MSEGRLSQEELLSLLQDAQVEQATSTSTITQYPNAQVKKSEYKVDSQKKDPDSIKNFSNVSQNIELEIRVEIGGLEKYLHEIFLLRENSILDLQKSQTEPVDIFIEDKLIGKGKVVVSDENFGVRISYLFNENKKRI